MADAQTSVPAPKSLVFFGLIRRRQVLLPTWRGWLIFFLTGGLFGFFAVHTINPFLSVNAPISRGVLVVEGWLPDRALEGAVAEFKRNHYEKLFVTGGPLEWGAPLSEYKTYAELGAATLIKLGLSTNSVQAVPAPLVHQDRTYTSAVFLRTWFRENNLAPTQLHLMTVGTHSRRSRLLYEKAFGKEVQIGITSIPDEDYDSQHWWRSSQGVRVVISETIAYGYARFFFNPPKEAN